LSIVHGTGLAIGAGVAITGIVVENPFRWMRLTYTASVAGAAATFNVYVGGYSD
jgi:hypothetical protein